jgi:hypothetical protein
MLDALHINLRYSHDDTSHIEKISYNHLSSKKTKYKNKKILFLARDPLDTVVSSYFQCHKRIKVFHGTISDFIRDERYGIRKIVRFHNIWYENKHIPKDFLFVRYEDLHSNPLKVLKSITFFLDIQDICENTFKESIEFASFENMQQLEREGYYDKKYGIPVKLTDNNDIESFKVRKGKIGGYVDYLHEEDIAFCRDCLVHEGNPFY